MSRVHRQGGDPQNFFYSVGPMAVTAPIITVSGADDFKWWVGGVWGSFALRREVAWVAVPTKSLVHLNGLLRQQYI